MKKSYCPVCGGTGWRNPTGWHLMRWCTNCETGRDLRDRLVWYDDWLAEGRNRQLAQRHGLRRSYLQEAAS